jgi:hypothetical protein|nr:MAG TPA: Baseplate structural protein [Caudoviricetes sp.]
MARTIQQIEESITGRLQATFSLSTSAASEWRLWVHCVAYCIYSFELVLDAFKREMDADAEKEVAGTVTWYNDKCYEFQMGHELVFDTVTGLLEYPVVDESARVIKIASVNVAEDNTIMFRVATEDEAGKIVPLTSNQLLNFKNYIDAIKFAGTKSEVISTDADEVRYDIKVYYNPANPVDSVQEAVLASLEEFKTAQKFGGVIYSHKMLEAVTAVAGVVTAKMVALSRKGTEDEDFIPIDTMATLHAGYFNYTEDSKLEMVSINDI